jgi:hypothetical protein
MIVHQNIFLCEFDGPGNTRNIVVTVSGTESRRGYGAYLTITGILICEGYTAE